MEPRTVSSIMCFNQPGLLEALCEASPEDYDRAEFGIISMDLDGIVSSYNLWESNLSGLTPQRVLGRHFFTQVAPCTNNFMVSLRYEGEELDETIDYVFSYRLRLTNVRLRLLRSINKKRQFLLVERR